MLGDFRARHPREKSQRRRPARRAGRPPRAASAPPRASADLRPARRRSAAAFSRSSSDHRLRAAAALLALLMAAVIDEQPAHRLRAEREAVRASLPLAAAFVLKPQPRLVDERRRLQRVIAPLAREISAGDAAQLAVDQRKQLVRRTGSFSATLTSEITARAEHAPPDRFSALAPGGGKLCASGPFAFEPRLAEDAQIRIGVLPQRAGNLVSPCAPPRYPFIRSAARAAPSCASGYSVASRHLADVIDGCSGTRRAAAASSFSCR